MRSKIWKKWIRIAEIIGTVQMTLILTIVYFSFVGIMYLPFKLLSDPLRMKSIYKTNWRERTKVPDVLESMKNQY